MQLRIIAGRWLFLAGISSLIAGDLGRSQVVSIAEWTPWTRWARFCLGDLRVVLPELEPYPIPVGCEVIDCCPGCPGPGSIDWRIRVEGDPLESVTLIFENLPDEAARGVEVEGNAKWTAGSTLIVGKGEAILRGLPGDLDRPPVAMLGLSIDEAAVETRGAAAAEELDQRDVGAIEVTIDQLLGGVIVNEFSLGYELILCPPILVLQDIIDLNNNVSDDRAVVCVDGRRASGCIDDETWRGNDRIGVGNLLSRGACRSEVTVFSDDNAMELLEGVNVWTDLPLDRLPINLSARLNAPVSVWVAAPGTVARATADLANANLLYNDNHVGVGFGANLQDVSNNTAAVASIGTGCVSAGPVQGTAFFTPNRLNVYYVNAAFTGVNCGVNRNIQYVGTTANSQTLAHEFGHSFTLAHTNGLAGFPANNVMVGGGAGRTHFSEGQAFRVNVNTNSTLNTNGVRAGPTRNCPDATTTDACPALARDAVPN